MADNKVTYGFSNVHYAMYQESTVLGELGTYGTPKRIPGGVGFSPTVQGGTTDFHADNINYYAVSQDNGVQGDLEMALFPDEFLIDILQWKKDDKNVLAEISNVPQKPFALLFEVQGNEERIRVCYLYCLGSKPNDAYITSAENATIQGKTMGLTGQVLQVDDNHALASYKVKESADPELFNKFFNEVYIPTFVVPKA